MKQLYKFLTLFALLALFLVPTGAVHAQGPGPSSDGRVIFGSNYTVKSGDTFTGDLVVFGGNVTVEENADLKGNLVVFGGTVKSDGQVNGDLVIIGGQVELQSKAHVTGDVVTVGGQLQKADGAAIDGEVVNNIQPDIQIPTGKIPPSATEPTVPTPSVNFDFDPFWSATGVLFRAVAVALLAMVVVMFLQPQLNRVGHAITAQPLMSGGIGLLTVLVAPLAVVILTVTIILIPVAFVGVLLLVFAWLFGVIALGQEVGERFTRSINQSWAPVLTTGFGTFLLMLVGGAIGEIPCVGWLAPLALGLLGIGAVAVTWFGSRSAPANFGQTSGPSAGSGQVPEQLPPAS
jgi:cytoskeletal protein CcmA (bactofilin family)